MGSTPARRVRPLCARSRITSLPPPRVCLLAPDTDDDDADDDDVAMTSYRPTGGWQRATSTCWVTPTVDWGPLRLSRCIKQWYSPASTQSTATQRGSARHAVRQASTVVTLDCRSPCHELRFTYVAHVGVQTGGVGAATLYRLITWNCSY